MKKFSALIISLVMIAAMLVPCAVSADTTVTVTNFQDEQLGEYTGNLIYNPNGDTFVNYEIKEEGETKYLHADFSGLNDENKPSSRTRTGINLLTGNETIGAVRVEARVRIPQVIGSSGNYICVYTQMGGGQLGQLGWISDKAFAVGAAPNGVVINDTTYDTNKSGSVIRTYSSIVGQWYNLTFVANPDGGKVSYIIRDANGELLGSASWTNSGPFTEWSKCFKELRLSNEYLDTTRAASIDVSEIKVAKVNVWKVNVSAGEGGSAMADDDYVAYGGTANITATPDEGYEVDTVTVDGNALVANDSGVYEITNITKDTDVAVTFKAAAPSAPAIDNVSVLANAEYEGSPAAVVYAKVNGAAKSAGVVLKNAEGKELNLPAFDGDSLLTTGAFGIKVFGNAMVSGAQYSFVPYITYAGDDGDTTVSSEEQTFTFGNQ